MVRLFVISAAMVALAAPAVAQGFNPFGETTVNRYSWDKPSVRPAPSQKRSAALAPIQRPGAPAAPSFFGLDDDDAPPPPPKASRAAPAAGSPDGGGRPSISAATPPRVAFRSNYAAGSIVIDSGGRSLYYVVSQNEALRYPIAVGREGFAWTGVERVSRKAEWPEWRPPAEMRQRQAGLPEVMSGGVRNPLGARAIYLGSTLYRIHGTNDSRSIGSASSSGCFRMTNAHVVDLYNRVSNGATVHVVSRLPASISRGVAENDRAPEPARRTGAL